MATINLTGQQTAATAIKARTDDLRGSLDSRQPVWAKLGMEQRREWIKSGKDPTMTLAWELYVYLRDSFFREM